MNPGPFVLVRPLDVVRILVAESGLQTIAGDNNPYKVESLRDETRQSTGARPNFASPHIAFGSITSHGSRCHAKRVRLRI
jgi:hypothetical protein